MGKIIVEHDEEKWRGVWANVTIALPNCQIYSDNLMDDPLYIHFKIKHQNVKVKAFSSRKYILNS